MWNAERNQVGLLLYELSKLTERVELDLDLALQLNEKDKKFQKNLDKRRIRINPPPNHYFIPPLFPNYYFLDI